MAIDFDWSGFRALVRRLDDLLANVGDQAEFAEDLRRALTFLYTAGVTMPTAGEVFEDAGGTEFWSDAVSLKADAPDPTEFEESMTALAQRVMTSVGTLQPDGDAEADDIAELAEAAAAQVLDVAAALAEGSALFDAKRVQEAAWEWTFQFDEWGAHVLAAVSTLHELLWGSR